MLEQKQIQIDGIDFLLTTFPTMQGLAYQKKIAKLLGPVIAEIMKSTDESVNPMGIALAKLFDNLDEIDPEFIKEIVTKGASKGSMAINFDMEFAGKYALLFKLVQEIVDYNFHDVFTLVGSSLQQQ